MLLARFEQKQQQQQQQQQQQLQQQQLQQQHLQQQQFKQQQQQQQQQQFQQVFEKATPEQRKVLMNFILTTVVTKCCSFRCY